MFSLNKNKPTGHVDNSEDLYKTLFHSSSDAIMTIEPPDWKFTTGNPATIKMFNVRDENEFVSLSPGQLSPEKQPDGQSSMEKAKKMIEQAMKNGSNFFEWTHKRYGGENFPATVLLTKVKSGDKEFIQATVRDISQQKENEEIFKSRAEELERMNKLMIDRELKMIELKEKIKGLEAKIYSVK